MEAKSDFFLTEAEVNELTGIGCGRTEHRGTPLECKVSKFELQVQQLRTMGIAFFVNARGRPLSRARSSRAQSMRHPQSRSGSLALRKIFTNEGHLPSPTWSQSDAPLVTGSITTGLVAPPLVDRIDRFSEIVGESNRCESVIA
jgi:hypothetical protein